jgi:hypothetical protein
MPAPPSQFFNAIMDGIITAPWSPLPHQSISLLYTNVDVGYDQITPLSKAVFILSLVGAAFVALYGSSRAQKRRRGTVYVLKLFAVMLVALAGFGLLLPLLSSAALHERDDIAIIPNLRDPKAVNPQSVCPGYRALNVVETPLGLTADLILAGDPCNVYGTDIEALSLIVEYQAADRLHLEILPKYIGQSNQSWFILPETLVPKPEAKAAVKPQTDLELAWSNEPTFSFNVTRKSNGDVLFTTGGSQLVYEDQFIEFRSSLPDNYNIYGLGETIHGFRLGNNLTSKFLVFLKVL